MLATRLAGKTVCMIYIVSKGFLLQRPDWRVILFHFAYCQHVTFITYSSFSIFLSLKKLFEAWYFNLSINGQNLYGAPCKIWTAVLNDVKIYYNRKKNSKSKIKADDSELNPKPFNCLETKCPIVQSINLIVIMLHQRNVFISRSIYMISTLPSVLLQSQYVLRVKCLVVSGIFAEWHSDLSCD